MVKKQKKSDGEAHVKVNNAIKTHVDSKSSMWKKSILKKTKTPSEPSTKATEDASEFDPSGKASLELATKNDQTAKLLAGFESSDGSEVPEEDREESNSDAAIPSPPASVTALTQNALGGKGDEEDEPGTLYIGHLPHGFYERQMKSYFSQFGTISRLRISRNRKTGASKHYAYIEFASSEVADIVARTMDNYLMFGHILKVKVVPKEQIHENLWKGHQGRFKKIPWNGIERGRLKSADRETWSRRIRNEEQRRRKKAEQLKKLGYEFKAPEVRRVDSVPKKVAEETEQEKDQETPEQIEEEPAVEEAMEELLKSKKRSGGPKKKVKKAQEVAKIRN